MSTTCGGPDVQRRQQREPIALLVGSAALMAIAFAQDPGKVLPETKLDVTLAPARFLARSLGAWDPSAGFGRLQNQAVGYLMPMGPFSWVCGVLGIAPWVTQRLWLGALLVAGFWGTHRLARALGIATAPGRIVAALAYTLAPATMTTVAFQSAGQIPYALAPWVLVPLVGARDGRGPRRIAATSALAVAAMGGINGAAVLATLALPILWLATRTPGPDRRRLAGWWGAGIVAGIVWWAVALGVTIRYGVRFTAFTEQAATTTSTESATEIWRGTGNWVPYLFVQGRPWLPGGLALVTQPLAIIGSVLVSVGGVLGLARRDAPGRAWLLPAAALGALAVGAGYPGPGSGIASHQVQAVLDGPLAAFRNVHKFSPIIRLPLALGLGHLVAVAAGTVGASASSPTTSATTPARRRVTRTLGAVAPAGFALAILLAILPAITDLSAPGSFDRLPRAWEDAARWIDDRPGDRRALLLPGSAFAENRWGRPLDEPVASLARSPWSVRDLIPLGGNGSTRLLDALDTGLLDDHLPTGFVESLRRSGVGYLVVRNDLDLTRSGGPRPATVRRLLGAAEGLERAVSFGEEVIDPGSDGRLSPRPGDLGRTRVREIDIYLVTAATDRVGITPAAGSLVVSGGPEAIAALPARLTTGRTVYLTDDAPARPLHPRSQTVATDTARRRDRAFGSIRDNATPTLTEDQTSPRTGRDPLDRWPDPAPPALTTARVTGAASISDTNPPGSITAPESQPFAAFDLDPTSTWVPSAPIVGRALIVRFTEERTIGPVTVQVPTVIGSRISTIDVVTDAGRRRGSITSHGTFTVAPAPGATRSVRIEVAGLVTGTATDSVGFSEVTIGRVRVARPLVTAATDGGADIAAVSRATRDRYDLHRRDEDTVLDRIVDLAAHPRWYASGTAAPIPGPEVEHLLGEAAPEVEPSAQLTVDGTPAWHGLPALAPASAVDGDPGTAWLSAPTATAPHLTLRWDGVEQIDRLRLVSVAGGSEAIRTVAVIVGGTRMVRRVPASGVVALPAIRTDTLTLAFPGPAAASQTVAVAEIEIPALLGRAPGAAAEDTPVVFGCGQGPALHIDDIAIATTARTTVGSLRDGEPITWSACEPITLSPGSHHLRGTAWGGPTKLTSMILEGVPRAATSAGRTARIRSWGTQQRTVHVGKGEASVLSTTENHNAGWKASLDGESLTPVRVDGWRQGFVLPAGGGGDVVLTYAPARIQYAGLALGGLALVALLAAALVPRRHRPWTVPAERPLPDLVLLGIAVVVGLVLGGALVLALLPLLALPQRARRLPIVTASLVAAAGLIALLPALDQTRAWSITWAGSFSFSAQACAVIAWLALATSAVSPGRARPRDQSGWFHSVQP